MVCSTISFLKTVALTLALVAASSVQAAPLRGLQQQQNQGKPSPAPTPAKSFTSSPGPPDNWYVAAEASDYNNAVHADFFQTIKHIRGKGERYAVFDWDNTCMYGDISYTSVYYQMDNLVYRIRPEKFVDAFSLGYTQANGDECLPLGINSVLGKDVNGADVTYAQALNETAADYKFLYESYIAPANNLTVANATVTTPLTLAQVKETTEFKNFRAKIAFLTFGVEGSYGTKERLTCAMRIGMTVFPQLLVGMTEAEIRSLIRASVRWNLAAKLDSPTFTSTGTLAVEGDYSTGLRVFNGQETVMRSLRAYGTDVHIISASPQLFVEEVGKLLGLGYMVPTTNTWGVRFTIENGTFSGKLIDNYPITWGPGKAEIVNKFLAPLYRGKAPVYSSGDSDGDCDMLDTVRDGIVHVNNRLKDSSTCIQAFYELSCKYFMSEEPSSKNKYLLQGQDKAIGSWIPSGFSTKDGVTYKSNAITNNACAAYKFLHRGPVSVVAQNPNPICHQEISSSPLRLGSSQVLAADEPSSKSLRIKRILLAHSASLLPGYTKSTLDLSISALSVPFSARQFVEFAHLDDQTREHFDVRTGGAGFTTLWVAKNNSLSSFNSFEASRLTLSIGLVFFISPSSPSPSNNHGRQARVQGERVPRQARTTRPAECAHGARRREAQTCNHAPSHRRGVQLGRMADRDHTRALPVHRGLLEQIVHVRPRFVRPDRGLYDIPGANDEPYSDQSILYARQGRSFAPISVSDAIKFGGAKVDSTAGRARDGYRLVKRSEEATMIAEAEAAYTNICTTIAETLDTIFDKSTQLGYNVTRQELLILIDDVRSLTAYRIPHVLPVVILPFWDNCMDAPYTLLGVDGSACMFRLTGKYTNPLLPMPVLTAVNRTVREAKTAELLQRPGGTWSSGWCEDPSGAKWFADVISSNPHSGYGILRQQFNMHTGEEVGCIDVVLAMFVLARAYHVRASDWHTVGIGCLANSSAFQLLPLMLLLRLRMVLLVVLTVGYQFEGQQRHLCEAWLVMYPSIVEFMFFYYSLLNWVAKLCSRRVNDVLFGPTLIFLCVLHWPRKSIGESQLFGFDDRVTSLLSTDEMDNLALGDIFIPSVAFRVSGRIKSIFFIKLAVVVLNLASLLLSKRRSLRTHVKDQSAAQSSAEHIGSAGLNSYELTRLDYVVYGGTYLVSIPDWELLILVTPLRAFAHIWNHRVVVFSLEDGENGTTTLAAEPEFCRVDDPRLERIHWWEISARDIL